MEFFFEELKLKLENISELENISMKVYLFENKKTKKNPFIVYKMIFNMEVKKKILELLKNEIESYINLINEANSIMPEYNPDEEQHIFKIDKSEIRIIDEIYSYIIEEEEPEIISKNTLNEKNKIKTWIIRIELKIGNEMKQIFFFQKFIKSQFMNKKANFILTNDIFDLVEEDILSMGNAFDIIMIDDVIVSKKIESFEYVFDFAEYYRKKAKEFIYTIEQINFLKMSTEIKDKILKKIEISKRFAHKLYTAQRNKYYEKIDIKKLENLKESIPINIEIKDDKIIVDENTNLDDLVKVLNDDYEQSLITENKYISHKKEKL